MNCHNIKDLFPDYMTGELENNQKAEVQAHLADCADCRTELEDLILMWDKLGVLEEELPSPHLRSRFYAAFENYKEEWEKTHYGAKSRLGSWFQGWWPKKPVVQFALSCGLLIIGLVAGSVTSAIPFRKGDNSMMRKEVNNMRHTLAVSLMDQSSPTDRMKGVNLTYGMNKPQPELISALLNTLDTDPNISVRLAAVDALYLFHNYPAVKEGLIQSLARQESPMVQASLIDLMVSIRERRAVEALKTLLLQEDLNPDIKNRIELGLQQLRN
jgi:hypothetical protein